MTTATTATSEMTRVIFNCKHCRNIWAKEYRTFIPTNSLYVMVEVDGVRSRHFYSEDINGRCPQCNSCFIEGNRVEGTVTDHQCDARCMGAKSGNCECSCGGKNHGISHM